MKIVKKVTPKNVGGRPDEDTGRKTVSLRRETIRRVERVADGEGMNFSRCCEVLLLRGLEGLPWD